MRPLVDFLRLLLVAIRAWLVRRFGRRPSRRAHVERSIENIAAVHEAGHALLALRCTRVDEVHVATIDLSEQPRVEYSFAYKSGVDAAWCSLVIGLAGIAAEIMVFGRFRSALAESDVVKARAAAELLAAANVYTGAPTAPKIDFARMFESSPSPAALAAMDDAYRKARSILLANTAAHARLTGHLLGARRLESRSITAWFGDRAVLRRLRHFGVFFV